MNFRDSGTFASGEAQTVQDPAFSIRVQRFALAATLKASAVGDPTFWAFPVIPSIVCLRHERIPVMAVGAVVLVVCCFLVATVADHR